MPTVSSFSSTNYLSANDGVTERRDNFTTSFTSLGVPTGATINGFKFTIRASKASEEHTFNSDGPLLFKVQKGSGDSATLSPAFGSNDSLTAVGTDFGDITLGSSSQLFGITWDSTTANAIQLIYDSSFDDTPEEFSLTFESAQCEVTYTLSGNGLIKLTSGFLKLKTGKITL